MGSKRPALTVDILTLFPGMFAGPFSESLLKRARENGTIQIDVHNLRHWSDDKRHQKVDDRPYGGGAGMVIRAEPIYRALKALGAAKKAAKAWVVYLSPQGRKLTQKSAQTLAKKKHLILICGHYEGIDERAKEWIDEEVSVGDYVLTGGELPAMVLTDTVARLVPGVVKEPESVANESFSNGFLEHPHYTRPAVWRKKGVPPVLMSGDHRKIREWREQKSREVTRKKRPELLS